MNQCRKIYKKILIGILVFSICVGVITPGQVILADTRVGTVTATSLTVRADAGTSYEKLGSLSRNTQVSILGEKTDADGTIWYQISYEGKTAYVSGDYVAIVNQTPDDNTGAEEPRTGIVTTGSTSLTVRKGAGASFDKIGSVAKGAQVTILGEQKDADGVVWYQIEYQGGTGYVSGKYITLTDQPGIDDPEPENPTPEEPDDPEPEEEFEEWVGVVNTASLNLRSGPGTSYMVLGTGLTRGYKVTVLGEAYAGDGAKWYKINFEGLVGYCMAKYIDPADDEAPEDDPEFEAYLEEQGFPESYKKKLRSLHAKYPNWVFVAQYPKLEWDDVLYEQYKFGDMLPSGWVGTRAVSILWKYNAPASWKSTDPGAFDWTNCTWNTGWDGSAWVIPSKELVAYYLDPRNFMEENTIFQFLDMSYDDNVQTVDGVRAMASASSGAKWLAGTVTDQDGAELDYSAAIHQAGKDYGISPYILLSIINQEVHENHGSVKGTFSGYEGYYNFYNIGAYVDRANGFTTAVARGLWYAKGGDNGSTSLGRPWDTRLKAIRGGAQHFAVNYVKKQQDTLYLKRFDIFDGGNGRYNHQFSTDIQGPYNEAKKLAAMYTEELRQNALVFKIPVYEDMPSKACEQPMGDECPNNKLESLTVGDYTLSPAFKMDKTSYTVEVGTDSSVTIKAESACDCGDAKITGTGQVSLKLGENQVKVICTAENGDTKTYTLNIIRVREENCPTAVYTDLDPDAWYHGDVDYVVENDLMNGVSEGEFAPDRTTSRAMIVTILYRMSGEEVSAEMQDAMKFTDVQNGRYYTDAVAWAAYHGIVNGKTEKLFAPDEPITREQIMTMLYRYAQYKGYDVTASGDISVFPDASETSTYAKNTVAWAYGAGLLNGVKLNGQVSLQPKGDTIRVQAAAFIHRFCEYISMNTQTVALEIELETEETMMPAVSKPDETDAALPENQEVDEETDILSVISDTDTGSDVTEEDNTETEVVSEPVISDETQE